MGGNVSFIDIGKTSLTAGRSERNNQQRSLYIIYKGTLNDYRKHKEVSRVHVEVEMGGTRNSGDIVYLYLTYKCIKYQLMFFLKEQYSKNLTEVTFAKNSDGLSGMDKMEMNMQKLDEGAIILANVNVRTGMARIIRDNDFDITEEEIEYYIKNHNPSNIQAQLVYSYWSVYFGPFRNTKLIGRKDYIRLLLILKKRLLLEAGNEGNDFSETAKLPYLLTGNLEDKLNTRIIRNNKFISKVDKSYIYDKLINGKYKNLTKIEPEYIIGLLSSLINSKFTYVAYEADELLGKPIEYSEDKIADELLFFLNSI